MAKKSQNEHAKTTPGETETAHEHAGSSVGFYIFIALILGVITYIEFALVEHQETWFSFMSGTSILIWLIVLSVVKFILVVMFFMHLKDDDRTFTGFFTSGMVIAVGTLIALSALFTVRSLATAQTPQQEGGGTTAGAGAETGTHGEGREGAAEPSLAHRFEYPPPKTLDSEVPVPDPSAERQGDDARGDEQNEGDAGANTQAEAGAEGAAAPAGATDAEARTSSGLPQAPTPPAATLPDPFAPPAQGAATEGEEQAAPPPQDAAAPAADPAAAGAEPAGGALLVDADIAPGEGVFNLSCATCHQPTGTGVPGAFPPLAGHAPELALAEGGRDYLINVVLYGLQGEIQVDGQTYNGVMAPWGQLSDDEIASTLNYVLRSWENAELTPQEFPAFTPDEVAAQRDAGLSSAQVHELRQTLELP